MGRQIRFYLTDSDIVEFRKYLSENDLTLYDYHKEEVTKNISIWDQINHYFVGNDNLKSCNSLIEYIVPSRNNNRSVPDTKIGISCGRVYMFNDSYENEEAVKTYKLIIKYIKKNYMYSKDAHCYFSWDFIEMYKSFKYHITM